MWHELALQGGTSGQFERQITDLQPFLAQNWTAKISKASGNPVYERPVVLVIYRDDHRLLLDAVRPKQGAVRADFGPERRGRELLDHYRRIVSEARAAP